MKKIMITGTFLAIINEFHSGRSFVLSLTYRFGGYKAKQHEELDTSRFGI